MRGPSTGRLWLDSLVADLLATVVVFGFSRAYRNSSVYDAYWSVIPPLLTCYWWARGGLGVEQLRCWLVTVLVVVWSVRLTGNWVYGFAGLHHEDWRYALFRERAGRWEFVVDLVAIHLVPTAQVFLGMLPVYVCMTHPGRGVSWLAGLALFGVAAAPGQAWWLFVGAVAMLAMFLGASIPMMEQRSLQRRPGYQSVIARVPRFVPRPPRRTAA
ncbi:MAG: DUF1295 domain-containing protein [Mycobacterium sp.]|nr:MAG: DUF1295 domain-containing protein [Mycobacterium sp.]